MEVLLTNPILKQKATMATICGLNGNKIGHKEIPMGFVGVKL
jgi:hypothetical protein